MINVTYSRERWDDLARRAREKFQNAAALAKAGAEKVEEKTEVLRARTRLEREISDLQEEINLQMQIIGELTYAAHQGRDADEDSLRQILEYVDSLCEQLEAHRQELEASRGMLICSCCGAANDPGYVYCHNCGQPLSK